MGCQGMVTIVIWLSQRNECKMDKPFLGHWSGPIPHRKTTRTAGESNGQRPHHRMGQRPMAVVRGDAGGCLHGMKPSRHSQSDQRAYGKVHGKNRGGERGSLPQ